MKRKRDTNEKKRGTKQRGEVKNEIKNSSDLTFHYIFLLNSLVRY